MSEWVCLCLCVSLCSLSLWCVDRYIYACISKHTHTHTQHAYKKDTNQTHLLSPENSNFILTSSWETTETGRSKSGQKRSLEFNNIGCVDMNTKFNDDNNCDWLVFSCWSYTKDCSLRRHVMHFVKTQVSYWGGKMVETVFPRGTISGLKQTLHCTWDVYSDYSLWLQLWSKARVGGLLAISLNEQNIFLEKKLKITFNTF